MPPRLAAADPNPTQLLDYERFSSDELSGPPPRRTGPAEPASPGVPVTTNFMVIGHEAQADYWTWAPDTTSSPGPLPRRPAQRPQRRAILLRQPDPRNRRRRPLVPHGALHQRRELAAGQLAKTPGQLLRNTLPHVAHGADAVGYFQWRASRAGAETVPLRSGAARRSRHRGLARDHRAGRDLGRLGELVGTRVVADVAVLYDWQARWACDQPNHLSAEVRYVDQPLTVHGALRALGVTTNLIGPASTSVRVPPRRCCPACSSPTTRSPPPCAPTSRAAATQWSSTAPECVDTPTTMCDSVGIPGPSPTCSGSGPRSSTPWRRAHRWEGFEVSEELGGTEHQDWTGTIWSEDAVLRGATTLARYADGPLGRSTGSAHAPRGRTRRGLVRGNPARPWSHAIAFRARLP